MVLPAMASASHVVSHAPLVGWREAAYAATRAVAPNATTPHPGTAVNEPACSIVSRMKRRLSIARAERAGGSPGGRKFGTEATPPSYPAAPGSSSTLLGKVSCPAGCRFLQ